VEPPKKKRDEAPEAKWVHEMGIVKKGKKKKNKGEALNVHELKDVDYNKLF